jgi:hypothetical protein
VVQVADSRMALAYFYSFYRKLWFTLVLVISLGAEPGIAWLHFSVQLRKRMISELHLIPD